MEQSDLCKLFMIVPISQVIVDNGFHSVRALPQVIPAFTAMDNAK